MPVLVTAPGDGVGPAAVRRLVATGGQVRAFCGPDDPVDALRRSGAICAVGSLLDEGHLETAMEQVHTVVHLGIGPFAAPEAVVEETATVVSAAVGAGVRRLLLVSVPGAGADHPLHAAAAEAEELVAAVPFPSTTVRVSLVDTEETRARLARAPLPPDLLETPVAPVQPDDLADLVAWLDDRRFAATADHELLAADGPEILPLGDYLRRVGLTPQSLVGRVVGRLRGGDHDRLQSALAGPWVSGPEVPDAWATADLRARPVTGDGGR